MTKGRAKRGANNWFILLAALYFVLFSAGCGKMGNPLPPQTVIPPAVHDVRGGQVAEECGPQAEFCGPNEQGSEVNGFETEERIK